MDLRYKTVVDDVTASQTNKLLQTERVPSRSSKGDSLPADDTSIEEGAILTTGKNNIDFVSWELG